MTAQFVARVTFILGMSAPVCCQTAPPAPAPPYALNTTGLKAPGFFFAMRNGLFENIALTPRAPIFRETYRNYVYAYSAACEKKLPPDTVELTESQCSHSHRNNGQDVCDAWKPVGTRVFADPRFIKHYYSSVGEVQDAYKALPDFELMKSNAKDIAILKSDIALLLRQNDCTSPDIKLFNENLLRFANADPPFQKSSEKSAIKSLYTGCMATKPKEIPNTQWISYCRCIDRQYEDVLTPAEKARYTEDYSAFEREAIMNHAGQPGFQYRLSTPQNACRH
jgi:hypothetical protein